jgi:hypothetical protein
LLEAPRRLAVVGLRIWRRNDRLIAEIKDELAPAEKTSRRTNAEGRHLRDAIIVDAKDKRTSCYLLIIGRQKWVSNYSCRVISPLRRSSPYRHQPV